MPYQFTCPHCQTKTLVDEQFSGHTGRCVTCDQPIEIPDFAARAAGSMPYRNRGLSPSARRAMVAAFCALAIFGLVVAAYQYAAPAISTLAAGRDRAIAIRNLEKIAGALNAYAADHGTYPPPIIRAPDGTAMHSWRVLILPYLNETALYNQYDLNQPWDATNNYELIQQIPAAYISGAPSNWSGYECSYQLVTGDRTLFPPSGPLGPKRILDDPSKTALVVEAMGGLSRQNYPNAWTEPTELVLQAMTGAIGTNPGTEIGSVTEGGAAIATVDGRGHFLEESTAPEIVLAILTASGGEPLADDVMD